MSRRRRVVLVGPAHPYRGGIAQFTDSLARGLRLDEHDVSIVTFSRQYPKVFFPGKSQYTTEHASVHRRSSDTELESTALIDSVDPRTWFDAGRHIADVEPHAVIFQYWLPFFAPAYGVLAGRIRKRLDRVRILAVVHNVLPHERRPGDVTLARYFLRRCDGIVALSTAVASDARSLGTDATIRTLSHPIYEHFGETMERDRAREELGLSKDANVMLFFGFVREYKGLHVLIDAMPRIAAARKGAELVVAGEFYENEAKYRRQIRNHGLEGRVHLHNHYIPEDDVAMYFSAADVVVQPYVTATQSGVIQTAYHFERPVIVTDVGGLAEVVPHEKAGLVVESGNPAALADACIRFFDDNMNDRLTAGVRLEKQKHSWEFFVRAIEEMVG